MYSHKQSIQDKQSLRKHLARVLRAAHIRALIRSHSTETGKIGWIEAKPLWNYKNNSKWKNLFCTGTKSGTTI